MKVDKVYEQQKRQAEYHKELKENACSDEDRMGVFQDIKTMLNSKKKRNGNRKRHINTKL